MNRAGNAINHPAPLALDCARFFWGGRRNEKGGWQLFKDTGLRKIRTMSPFFCPGFGRCNNFPGWSKAVRNSDKWIICLFSHLREAVHHIQYWDVLGELVKWLSQWFHSQLSMGYIWLLTFCKHPMSVSIQNAKWFDFSTIKGYSGQLILNIPVGCACLCFWKSCNLI